MKKLTSILLALLQVLSLFAVPTVAEGNVLKIGILASSATHGWPAAVAHNAESRCKELHAENSDIRYKLAASENADGMAAQFDGLMIWGADAIVICPQWGNMEAPVQRAIDAGVVVVAFDVQIDVDGVYLISGDNLGIRDAGRTNIKVITGGGGSQEYFNMMPDDGYRDIWLESALYSPAMVRDAVDLAIQILTTEDDIPAVTVIPTTIVDRENVHPFLLGGEDHPY